MATGGSDSELQQQAHADEINKHSDLSVEKTDDRQTSRTRSMTEKGRLYAMERMVNKLLFNFKELKHKYSYIDGCMHESPDLSELRRHHHLWLSMYEDYLKGHSEYVDLLGDEDNPLDDKNCLLAMFKENLERWFLHAMDSEIGRNVTAHDSVSQVKKHSSRCSRVSSVSSARLQEEQHRAEIAAKLSVMSKKKDIELAKVNLKLKEEQLALETEMGIVNARTKVLDELDQRSNLKVKNECVSNVSTSKVNANTSTRTGKGNVAKSEPIHTVFKCHSNNLSVVCEKQLSCINVPIVHIDHNDSTAVVDDANNASRAHANLSFSGATNNDQPLVNVIRQLRKPVPDIKCFSGDPLEYKRFMRQFKSKIVCYTDDNDELLNYLEQFTTGEANKIVCGFSYLDAYVGYPLALKELDRRYGSQEVLANAFVKRALDWPLIKSDSPKSLDQFAVFLEECKHAVQTIEAVKVLQYPDNMKRLVSKLPFNYQEKWRSIVADIKLKEHVVRFEDLSNFVKYESVKACDPTYGREALRSDQKPNVSKSNTSKFTPQSRFNASFVTSAVGVDCKTDTKESLCNSNVQTSKKHCLFCDKSSHTLDNCYTIMKKPYAERITFLKSKGLCYGCIRPGHLNKDCKNRSACFNCHGRHPTCLHDDSRMQRLQDKDLNSGNVVLSSEKSTGAFTNVGNNAYSHTGVGGSDCCMAVIPVNVMIKNGLQSIVTYAFLDPGSNVSFITDDLLHKLGGNGKRMSININTMGEAQKMDTRSVSGLKMADLNLKHTIDLGSVYTKDKIPISKCHIPTKKDISNWAHLEDVILPTVNADIGLLIGNNVPDAYTPLQVRTGPRGSPHATQSLLGWIVWNVMRDKSDNSTTHSVNQGIVTAIKEHECLRQLDKLVRDTINTDFPEKLTDDKREWSQEDKRFIHSVESSIELLDGHYVIGLPFKKENTVLPNNEEMALRRLAGLKHKLNRNTSFRDDYVDFMKQILEKGYAEAVPLRNREESIGRVWYIPHHGVYHPKKPNKLRVVFDCAASYQGLSLNSVLLQGPDMTNNMLGVLMRFRQENIAVMGDIEMMFYQVRVPKQDRDFLRFYWWPGGDTTAEPHVYRMTVHLFGATSSPSCCNYALRQTAADNADQFDHQITDGINRNFYVDDYLSSLASKYEAIRCIKDTSSLCQLGGFRLTKWISNDHDVLETIRVEDRAEEVKTLDLKRDNLPSDRALGVFWVVESDSLSFKIGERHVPCTRRGILSLTSSIYDPIGFLSPFIIVAKQILQEMCSQGIGWDDELTDSIQLRWKQWVDSLSLLDDLQIARCYRPLEFGSVVSYELHNFSDASDVGYGMVVYFRKVDDIGRIYCSMVLGKARVSPLKRITIPRMELTAATALVRINKVILNGSMSVLRYLNNETSRFQTFVANRLAVIRDATNVSQWRFVNSKLNPADCASRGLSMRKLLSSQQWFNGPEFLWRQENEWPEQISLTSSSVNANDPEIKKVVNTVQVTVDNPIDILISHFSDWFRLRKVLAWLLVARRNLQQHVANSKRLKELLNNEDISSVEQEQRLQEAMAISRFTRLQSVKDIKSVSSRARCFDTTFWFSRVLRVKLTNQVRCLWSRD